MQLPSQAVPYGKLPDAGTEQARNVHLSPADQFDNSRPFLYNGQWWIANGGNLYPISIPPQMSFAPPVVPSPSAPRPSDVDAHHHDSLSTCLFAYRMSLRAPPVLPCRQFVRARLLRSSLRFFAVKNATIKTNFGTTSTR
ncbi:hypothetical protein LB505_007391 [Fusarium chuoi]|nr:hypothetical protein LB505_007391 [Fusarium chuoi]